MTMSATPTIDLTNLNRVELSLAADVQLLFLARMTGAAVASRAGFDYEQIEDLRLAIDELCVRLMNTKTGPARITLQFQWDDDGAIDVMATCVPDDHLSGNGCDAGSTSTPASYELSERILDALVDDHGEDTIGVVQRGWLRMRRRNPLG